MRATNTLCAEIVRGSNDDFTYTGRSFVSPSLDPDALIATANDHWGIGGWNGFEVMTKIHGSFVIDPRTAGVDPAKHSDDRPFMVSSMAIDRLFRS